MCMYDCVCVCVCDHYQAARIISHDEHKYKYKNNVYV